MANLANLPLPDQVPHTSPLELQRVNHRQLNIGLVYGMVLSQMKLQTKPNLRPLRIVLTGGPGAGKTFALNEIKRLLGTKSVISPEAATLLYSGGFPRFSQVEAVKSAQTAIYHVQKNLEDVLALRHPRKVVFCDRGTIDGAAYWPTGTSGFFRSMKTTLNDELARYDAVLFLQTAAMEEEYIQEGNLCRTESPKEAISLDEKLKKLWRQHPNFLFVPRQDTLEKKLAVTVSHLKHLLH